MPEFAYSGVIPSGERVSGHISARDRTEAVRLLRGQKVRLSALKSKGFRLEFSLGAPRARIHEISRFTKQFAAMAGAGLPLVQCMDTLASQSQSKALSQAASSISADIKAGTELAESLKRHRSIFSDLYCNMVAAGEASGSLSAVLSRLAEYLEKSSALRRKVTGALTYPAVLLIVAIAAAIVLFTYVVPKFAAMFGQLGGELPQATQTVMALSSFAQQYYPAFLAGLLVAAFAIIRIGKTDRGAYLIDKIWLAIPFIGDLIRKSSISRFSQTLETLLSSGVGIVDALSTTAKTAGNKVLEKGLSSTINRITTGQTLNEPLRLTGLFPPMVIDMITVGEKTGDLAGMLGKISAFYKDEVDTAVESLTSVIEPVMIVMMGAIFGVVLYAMYMPMFEMINAIG